MRRNLITRLGVASGVVAMVVAFAFLVLLRSVGDLRSANDRAADSQGNPQLVAKARAEAESDANRAQAVAIAGVIGSTVLLFMLTRYLSNYIIVPLRRTSSAAQRLADGDLSARVAEEGDAEPRELARAFNTMASNLQAQQSELEGQNRELAARREALELALAQLDAEKRQVEVFHRVGEQLAAAHELSALAAVTLSELADAAGAEAGFLYTVDPEGGPQLVLQGTHGLSADDLEPTLRQGDGLAGRALAEGRTVTAERAPGTLSVRAFGRDVDLRHEAHVPLRLGDTLLGVVSLARLDDEPFETERLRTVQRLAEQAAVALSNVVSFRRAVRQAQINRAVLDATPDPVGLFDARGELVVLNEPMASLMAAAGGEIDVPGEDPDREIRDQLEVDERTYNRYAAPVRDATGARMGRIVALTDVTAERETERLKDEFFALVSHELRTPLTSIIGYLELVLGDEEELSVEARRFLEVVQRNARRLLRLVGDMLFVAQVEAGRLSLERTTVDLGLVAADSVEAARPAADRGRVELVLVAEPVRTVTGDRDRFGQMLDNLVSNALKFTPDGGRVEVRLVDAGDAAVLTVTDDGIGISPDDQERLFERFFRSAIATDRAIQGAGLGLTIVKTIVEAHGGTIEVSSREGAGTTMRATIPYRGKLEELSAPPGVPVAEAPDGLDG